MAPSPPSFSSSVHVPPQSPANRRSPLPLRVPRRRCHPHSARSLPWPSFSSVVHTSPPWSSHHGIHHRRLVLPAAFLGLPRPSDKLIPTAANSRAAERTRFGRPRQIDKMRSDPKSILKMGPVEVVGSRRRLICRDGLQYDPDGCNHHRAMLLSSMLPPWPRSNAPRTRDMLVCYCSLSVSSLRSMPPRPSYSRTVYKPSLGLGRRPLVRPPTRQVFA